VLWPQWTEQLRSETGIDNGYHRCGGVEVHLPNAISSLDQRIAEWRNEGVAVKPLSDNEVHREIRVLNPEIHTGYLLPDLGQVRNPRHLKALYQACANAGVDLRAGCPVVDFVNDGDRIAAVKTPSDEYCASQFVVASGAWSRNLLRHCGHEVAIEPVRGQIVLLETSAVLFRRVIEVGPRYLVPRSDGRILIGSTEERAGFEKRTTAAGIAGLLEFAQYVAPALGNARVEQCWAGLRPHAPGGLPQIGRVPGTRNLCVAAGHFRAGLQLSPMTAVLIRQLIHGQQGNEWARQLVP
jgi:glycine oxidase